MKDSEIEILIDNMKVSPKQVGLDKPIQVFHGTKMPDAMDIIKEGIKNKATGFAGRGGIFVAPEIEMVNDYPFRPGKPGDPVIMEGWLNGSRCRIGNATVNANAAYVRPETCILPANWAEDPRLLQAMQKNFDVIIINGYNNVNSFGSDRAFILNTSVKSESLGWDRLRKPIDPNLGTKVREFKVLAELSQPQVQFGNRLFTSGPAADALSGHGLHRFVPNNLRMAEPPTAFKFSAKQIPMNNPGLLSKGAGVLLSKGIPIGFALWELPGDIDRYGAMDGAGMCMVRIGMHANPYAIITAPVSMLGDLAAASDIQVRSMNLDAMNSLPANDLQTRAWLANGANYELVPQVLARGIQMGAQWFGFEAVSTENTWKYLRDSWPALSGPMLLASGTGMLGPVPQFFGLSELANAPSVAPYLADSMQRLTENFLSTPQGLGENIVRPIKLLSQVCQVSGTALTLPLQWGAQQLGMGQFALSRGNTHESRNENGADDQGTRDLSISNGLNTCVYVPLSMPELSVNRSLSQRPLSPMPELTTNGMRTPNFQLDKSLAQGSASFGVFKPSNSTNQQPFHLPTFNPSLGSSPVSGPIAGLGMSSFPGSDPMNFAGSSNSFFSGGNNFNLGGSSMPAFQTSFPSLTKRY